MKKAILVILAVLLLPVAAFANEIFHAATLDASGTATSDTFSVPEDAKEAGVIVVLTGSTNTRILLLGCRGTGANECIGDNITIANLNYNSSTVAGTGTETSTGTTDNATIAQVIAQTITGNTARSSIYLSDNMSSNGGSGADGKFFFSVPIANFPPASKYAIKAYERSATAGTISMEVNFR